MGTGYTQAQNVLQPTATRQPWQRMLLRTLQQRGQLAQQAASKLNHSERTVICEAGESWQACSAQLALLTLSSGSSEKELAPKSSPSWPGAPGCHVSGREKCKGKAWNRFQSFYLQPWVFPSSEPLAGQHLGHLYKTAVMEGTPSVPEAPGCTGKQPASSFISCEVAIQHTVLT